jgi:urease accessory protein
MSIALSFDNDRFSLDRLQLPTRYYHFNEQQNYIKLLSIGEGIFPKDKIKTDIVLKESDALVTTESATKVYPSQKEFGINKIFIHLQDSNLEFINDELILYKDAKLLQLLKIKADSNSTFFYADILSRGRSYESFDFTQMAVKNSFIIDNKWEYLEQYNKTGSAIQDYLRAYQTDHNLFAKVYIKSAALDHLLDNLAAHNFQSFEYTKDKKMIIGVMSSDNMGRLKKSVLEIWRLYRQHHNKEAFNLGKQ